MSATIWGLMEIRSQFRASTTGATAMGRGRLLSIYVSSLIHFYFTNVICWLHRTRITAKP